MPHRTSINQRMRETDAVILCGGQGTRLREVVSDRPKPMAEIAGRPFLDILIGHVSSYGYRRFIMCTGYMSEVIRDHYAGYGEGYDMDFSEEDEPLGTGGALKNAEGLIKSSPFLAMNGDSFCPADLAGFYEFHLRKKALASVVVFEAEDAADYGVLSMDDQHRITGFSEKSATGKAYINAGVYLFQRDMLSRIPAGRKHSLEYDLFPELAGGELYGYVTKETVMDIGTPTRYEWAKRELG